MPPGLSSGHLHIILRKIWTVLRGTQRNTSGHSRDAPKEEVPADEEDTTAGCARQHENLTFLPLIIVPSPNPTLFRTLRKCDFCSENREDTEEEGFGVLLSSCSYSIPGPFLPMNGQPRSLWEGMWIVPDNLASPLFSETCQSSLAMTANSLPILLPAVAVAMSEGTRRVHRRSALSGQLRKGVMDLLLSLSMTSQFFTALEHGNSKESNDEDHIEASTGLAAFWVDTSRKLIEGPVASNARPDALFQQMKRERTGEIFGALSLCPPSFQQNGVPLRSFESIARDEPTSEYRNFSRFPSLKIPVDAVSFLNEHLYVKLSTLPFSSLFFSLVNCNTTEAATHRSIMPSKDAPSLIDMQVQKSSEEKSLHVNDDRCERVRMIQINMDMDSQEELACQLPRDFSLSFLFDSLRRIASALSLSFKRLPFLYKELLSIKNVAVGWQRMITSLPMEAVEGGNNTQDDCVEVLSFVVLPPLLNDRESFIDSMASNHVGALCSENRNIAARLSKKSRAFSENGDLQVSNLSCKSGSVLKERFLLIADNGTGTTNQLYLYQTAFQ